MWMCSLSSPRLVFSMYCGLLHSAPCLWMVQQVRMATMMRKKKRKQSHYRATHVVWTKIQRKAAISLTLAANRPAPIQ